MPSIRGGRKASHVASFPFQIGIQLRRLPHACSVRCDCSHSQSHLPLCGVDISLLCLLFCTLPCRMRCDALATFPGSHCSYLVHLLPMELLTLSSANSRVPLGFASVALPSLGGCEEWILRSSLRRARLWSPTWRHFSRCPTKWPAGIWVFVGGESGRRFGEE